MRRRQVLVVVAGATALMGVGPSAVPGAAGAAAGVVRTVGSWGRAIEVPGLGALNKGRNADVLSVSCPSPGNCAAGGYYASHGNPDVLTSGQGFVVSEKNGRWLRAIEVPGLGALNKRGNAEVISVSCASAGNCVAGGYYGNRNPYYVTTGRGFVASEQNGRWREAIKVPGLGALNKGRNAEVSSVSCASPGNCAAAGFYTDGGRHQQGFVASEQNGRWGQAIEVPGLGALNKGGNAGVSSVSCASSGNYCAAGGDYADASGDTQSFVVSDVNGSWGTAQEAAANLGGGGGVSSVSCASAGNCSAGGQYADALGDQAFVISEVNGTWASAQEVAGSLNSNGDARVTSVSCGSAGNCAAGGMYDFDYNAAFVVSEKNGAWGQAINVPGLPAVARDAWLSSVSCGSAGNCAVGGGYDGAGNGVFVAREKNGVWGHESTLPGRLDLDSVNSVSCAPAGSCVAGGYYAATGRPFALQGFVT